MDAQHHRQLQQARQRIARSRRAAQGDVLRLSQTIQTGLNLRLQSRKHPVAMLLGAASVGVAVSRTISNLSGGRGWEQTCFRWAKSSLCDRWPDVLKMVWPSRDDSDAAEDVA